MSRLTEKTLRSGLRDAATRCEFLRRGLDEVGYPALRTREPGFEALMRVIVGQQLSVHAAAAIWGRVEALVQPMTPQQFLRFDDDKLRAAGLSRQKIAYMRSLADLVASGNVDFERIPTLDDDSAIAELIQIKGIGRWTAEVYMLFAHGRRDVWPTDDLALMVAAQRLRGMRKRPNKKQMLKLAEAWRPWRGAVSMFLWHYYRAASGKKANESGLYGGTGTAKPRTATSAARQKATPKEPAPKRPAPKRKVGARAS
ncbi:MAG: DNA-3-methyladenine glycosylase [Alphaproteobacteria bacterium]